MIYQINFIYRHGSFWSWDSANKNVKIWMSLGNENEVLSNVFEEIELVKTISHKYAVAEKKYTIILLPIAKNRY